MTIQARTVLLNLKLLANDSGAEMSYLECTSCICLTGDYSQTYDYQKYQHEIESIIGLLADEGYIYFGINKSHFFLTQKAIHKNQFTLSKIGGFLSDKSIDIAALIVAIASLIVAIIALMQ